VIERRIRAFDPAPGASTTLDGETIKVWRASVAPASGAPGEVLRANADELVVACGAHALRLHELQRPGGKRTPARQFLQGRPPLAGQRLGTAA
jgi:methionyl-tRNA formyltransferase